MRNKSLLINLIVVLLLSLMFLTGCTNKNDNNLRNEIKEEKNVDEKEDNEHKVAVRLNGAPEFNNDMAIVSETIEFKTYQYIIDREFNVLYSYEGNNGYVGGFMIKENEDETFDIIDVHGESVLNYGKYEYEKVDLLDGGFAMLTQKSDTYNSSSTVKGIYNLNEKKYVLEPKEEYLNAYTYGDNMICLDDNRTTFFNTRTQKVVKFEDEVWNEFIDGYSLESDYDGKNYLEIWDDNGGYKRIETKRLLNGSVKKTHKNGMLFMSDMEVYRNESGGESIRMHSAIYNLESGEIVEFGTEEYSMPTNSVLYTEDGYALLTFDNQGGTPYYTIIDKKGNRLFEPIKVNDNAAFQPDDNGEKRIIRKTELYEGNYLIVEDEGINTVLDKDNNVLVVAEEYETFLGITDGLIMIEKKEPGHYEEYYYKDLKGNKFEVYK